MTELPRRGRTRVLSRLAVAAGTAVVVLAVSSCTAVGDLVTTGVRDSAGMTRVEVDRQSAKQQFDLMGERYARMQELMTEAQEQIHTGTWSWLSGGAGGPVGGPTGSDPLPGATSRTSYHLELIRTIVPEGAVGDRADAEPVVAYFESKGWKSRLFEVPDELDIGAHRWKAEALTDDGYHLRYEVQENGQYNLEVVSGVFWCDRHQLSADVNHRIPEDRFFPPNEESLPGVYIPFPKWSDPYLWGPDTDTDWP